MILRQEGDRPAKQIGTPSPGETLLLTAAEVERAFHSHGSAWGSVNLSYAAQCYAMQPSPELITDLKPPSRPLLGRGSVFSPQLLDRGKGVSKGQINCGNFDAISVCNKFSTVG